MLPGVIATLKASRPHPSQPVTVANWQPTSRYWIASLNQHIGPWGAVMPCSVAYHGVMKLRSLFYFVLLTAVPRLLLVVLRVCSVEGHQVSDEGVATVVNGAASDNRRRCSIDLAPRR
jgi:hypothetical protein